MLVKLYCLQRVYLKKLSIFPIVLLVTSTNMLSFLDTVWIWIEDIIWQCLGGGGAVLSGSCSTECILKYLNKDLELVKAKILYQDEIFKACWLLCIGHLCTF